METIDKVDVSDKIVLCRVDFNVPLKDGEVSDDTRIYAALPTIEFLVEQGARVVLMSHLGRPAGVGYEEAYTLEPVAQRLSIILDKPVAFCEETVGPKVSEKIEFLDEGQILLLENLRFDKREKQNDESFCKELAALADIYVNDAFGAAHRAHASTAGIASFLPSYSGFLLAHEVETLTQMLEKPERPFVAIIGGAKVSDKIKVIDALIEKCDTLIIGGGMCFTFLMAQGYHVGSSLKEEDWVDKARESLKHAQEKGVNILLPTDVVVASECSDTVSTEIVSVDSIPVDMMGLDIGPETAKMYSSAIVEAKTVFWNGPMGVFEIKAFAEGTKAVATAVAHAAGAETIVGGGDSVAAINSFELADMISFISTGGGASMELIQGEVLPGVEALQ